MTLLETWLEQATRCLSANSISQVRIEIAQHYESAREDPMASGATPEEADRLAVKALGDAKMANRQYRRVLLTTTEARMLRESNWEARTICSSGWLKGFLLGLPAIGLLVASALFLRGALAEARWILAGSLAICFLLGAPFLPVYTPARGRIYRIVKWVVLFGALGLAFGSILQWSWLMASCVWPIFWIEWTRVSIRRKLPIAQWPKQLYL